MDEDFAELCGMHAGDGTIYKTNRGNLVWELRGGLHEREFYENYVYPLVKSLTDAHVWMGARGQAFGVRCCTRSFIERFVECGFPVGKKTHQVCIPEVIWKNPPFVKAFLRGLFATDGCGTLMKANGSSEGNYPVIHIGSPSEKLVHDVIRGLKLLRDTLP